MSHSFRKNFTKWNWCWSSPHMGRFWKRCLSKARRRYIKSVLMFGRGKETTGYETECNYKNW